MANCNYKVNIKDIQSKYSFKIFCAGDNADVKAEIGNLEDLTTTAKNNLVSAINEVHSDTETNATAISGLQSGKEDKSNKVTSISSASTDTQYPSAKAVYDSQETQDETISTLETNLEETKEELDYYKTIYNVLPKATGNGENITLDNTGESILKLDPRGQCKQETTTGKNLLPISQIASQTTNQLVVTNLNDGTINLNGTTNATTRLDVLYSQVLKANTTYTFTNFNVRGTTGANINIYDSNDTILSTILLSNSSNTYTPTTDITVVKMRLYIDNGQSFSNYVVKVQLEEGTSSSFEKFTYGASPNPSYPQQIHEVCGDNTIEVVGKNICSSSSKISNQIISFIPTKEIQKIFTLSFRTNETLSGNSVYLYINGQNGATIGYISSNEGYASITITLTDEAYNLLQNATTWEIRVYKGGSTNFNTPENAQIENSNSATEYEPYNEDTYKINLGVENLFNINGTYSTNSCEVSIDNNTLIQSNKSSGGYARTNWIINNLIVGKNYVISCNYSNPSGSLLQLMVRDSTNSNTVAFASSTTDTSGKFEVTFTATETNHYIRLYSNASDTANTSVVTYSNIQLEEGRKANSYSPFGQTPIKMRGIGIYEDYFVRNSEGQWCKYNAIGKVVFTGASSESWTIWALGAANVERFYINTTDYVYERDSKINIFSFGTGNEDNEHWRSSSFTIGGVSYDKGELLIFVNKNRLGSVDVTGLKAYLSINNLVVCVPLRTPYLSLVENETLTSQLDKIEKALAKQGQTNISQSNNDIPFKIYASALKEIE